MSKPARPYLSNGQVLESPPLSARIREGLNSASSFFGLYVATLFSLDAYAAGQSSSYNVRNQPPGGMPIGRSGWGAGGGSGGGGSGPGSGGGGKKLGRVDDIRGPECKSCG
ncbi:hypothetical protein MMC20_001459 [Loxospora ochrophaea]|nr:hypothetical protein [Loxospora ochrophaea]